MISALVVTNCESPKGNNNLDVKSVSTDREYYQLKVYTFHSEGQGKSIDKYLKEAYLPGIKKLGISNVGVFRTTLNKTDSIQKTFVLIPFTTIDQFLTLEDKLNKDEEHIKAGRDYIKASYEQAPYDRIESTLLKAFSDMPIMRVPTLESPRSERIYELRSYESATEQYYKNKVDMFNQGGEIKLFDRLEFNAVFYGEVISGSKMPNLMYMTTFSDQSSRDKHWKTFFDAPEWKELISMPQYKNNVSHAEIIFLYPTEYSNY